MHNVKHMLMDNLSDEHYDVSMMFIDSDLMQIGTLKQQRMNVIQHSWRGMRVKV